MEYGVGLIYKFLMYYELCIILIFFLATSTVCGVMSAVLLDPTDEASMDAIIGENDESKNFRSKIYTNPRYRKHAEAILSWLNYRGLLDDDEE